MKNPKSPGRHAKGERGGKNKNKDDKELEDLPVDLTFCFQAGIILNECLKKAEYIGAYTVSNSKSAMSKMIGIQIDNKLKKQQEFKKKFQNLIAEKAKKINLIQEEEINKLNEEINICAEELKSSTNDICKTLSENPDIPKNLIKAKRDQKIMINDLKKFQGDFVIGKLNNFEEIINSYISQRINIDDLRKEEMKFFKQLKVLNENLSKEEADYNKDQLEMNQSLLRMKKLLAKTKLEENIFYQYEENHIKALSALHESNFKEEENKMRREIEEKEKEREKITKLNTFVNEYLKDQKKYYEMQRALWEKKKTEKGDENGKLREKLQDKNTKTKNMIEQLTKDIQNYRMANDHLMDVASQLNYTNFNTIHGPDVKLPPIDKVPEQLDPNDKSVIKEVPSA
jgi:hypothetical protein